MLLLFAVVLLELLGGGCSSRHHHHVIIITSSWSTVPLLARASDGGLETIHQETPSFDHQQRHVEQLAHAQKLSSTNPSESLAAVEIVLREAPGLALAHFRRGLLLWKVDRAAEAVAALDSAIQFDPQNAEFLDERGVAAGTIGDDIRAEHFFRRAVAADPNFMRSRSNLGFALMQLRRNAEARSELKAALQIDPQDRLCAERLRQVEATLHIDGEGGSHVDSESFKSPWVQARMQARAQLEHQRRHETPSPPPHNAHQKGHSDLAAVLKDLTIGDIENLGAMFHLMRSAESYDGENKEILRRNFDLTSVSTTEASARKPYAMGLAVDIIAYQLTVAERSGLRLPATAPSVRAPRDVADNSEQGLSYTSVNQIVNRLDRWGLALLPSVIPRELCEAAELSILRALTAPDYSFSSIYNTDHRYDYPLKLGVTFDGLPEQQVLRSLTAFLEPALTQALGPDPTLVEFACVASFPGAPAQNPHSDVGMQMEMDALERAPLVSVFVYLEDVAENMAPLEVWLGTHKFHQFKHGDIMHHRTPPVRLAVDAGSVAIMDSRTLHRGSANSDTKPRLALYFSYMGSPAMGPEPLGSTFTIRSEYEEPAITLLTVIAGHGPNLTATQSHSDQEYGRDERDSAKESTRIDGRQRRGRWCFGNLNSVAGRLNAHYLFLACTPFLYPVGSGQEYHVDAVYDHQRRYIGIWVDGVQVALESRYLDVEDGPTSLRRVCHPQRASGEVRARHPSDYRGGVAEVWVGEPPPVAIGQSGALPKPGSSPTSGKAWLHIHNASSIRDPAGWIGLVEGERHSVRKRHFPAALQLTERSIRVSARLRPSSKDNRRLHAAVTIGGDGSFGHQRWQVDCIGTPLVLAWSTRRLEAHTKKGGGGSGPGSAGEAAKDAETHLAQIVAEQRQRDEL